jgi:hypothetical protein
MAYLVRACDRGRPFDADQPGVYAANSESRQDGDAQDHDTFDDSGDGDASRTHGMGRTI